MITAKVIGITMPVDDDIPTHEDLLPYTARVSNEANQGRHDTGDRLLAYCAREGHWSVFEMASVVVYVEAPRDITRQMLRHRSMHFQELSQRYTVPDLLAMPLRELRMQHPTNRQASVPCDDACLTEGWEADQNEVRSMIDTLYRSWIDFGAAKEVARVLLPEGLTMSRLYANATIRDWWHYCRVRKGHGTQPEHAELATKVSDAIEAHYPRTWAALRQSGENHD